MVNYSNGKVYKIEPICEHFAGDVYFGSTTKEYLSQRMDRHRSDFKRNSSCSSKILFQKFGVENCVIVLLEAVSATTKDELLAVEAKYIINNACVNKSIPLRTKKEWGTDNVEKIKEQQKLYRDENADELREKNKIYRDENADKLREKQKIYYDENADKICEKKKIYNITNADKIREKKKIYRDANKDQINEKQRQRYLEKKEQSIN